MFGKLVFGKLCFVWWIEGVFFNGKVMFLS